jgi:hypothetical protein
MARYFLLLAFNAFLNISASAAAPDADFYRRWSVNEFLRASDITAHIRILNVRTTNEMLDPSTGKAGYKFYEIAATVIEGFKGIEPGNIVFSVAQLQPSDPPNSGEYIVGLNNVDGHLQFEAVVWIEATPDLVQFARVGK